MLPCVSVWYEAFRMVGEDVRPTITHCSTPMLSVVLQGRCKACQIWVNKQRQMLKPPVEKTCTMCNVLKPATDFNRDSNCSDGLKVAAHCNSLQLPCYPVVSVC